MKRILNGIFVIGILVALAAGANAATISLSGGTAGTIPGGAPNDFIPRLFPGPGIGGYYGSQIMVSVPVLSTFTLEFFGAESGSHNKFTLAGSELFDHPDGTIIAPDLASPLETYVTSIIGTGLLPFSFDVSWREGSVANGSNPDDFGRTAKGPNFFATFNPFGSAVGSGGRDGNVIYLFLDDGGAGPDYDYDDFLVRLSIQPVPEPSTMLLFGSGLVGLVGIRRKFRQ